MSLGSGLSNLSNFKECAPTSLKIARNESVGTQNTKEDNQRNCRGELACTRVACGGENVATFDELRLRMLSRPGSQDNDGLKSLTVP